MVFKFNSAKAISYVNNYFGGANPFYYVFRDEKEGVNFISQCVFAGCDGFVANCPEWFYQNEKNFSQSWIDGEKLKEFLLSNVYLVLAKLHTRFQTLLELQVELLLPSFLPLYNSVLDSFVYLYRFGSL